MATPNDTFSRRSRMDLMDSSEKLITEAVWEIEKLGCDVKLTEAVILLTKAKDLISDFIDKK